MGARDDAGRRLEVASTTLDNRTADDIHSAIMADPKTKRIKPAVLQADADTITNLEEVSGYKPANAKYSPRQRPGRRRRAGRRPPRWNSRPSPR